MDHLLAMDYKRKIPNNEDSALCQANKIKEYIASELVNQQLMESGQELGPVFSLIVNEIVKGNMKCRKEFRDMLADITPTTALNGLEKLDESFFNFTRRMASYPKIVTRDDRKKAPWPDFKGNDLFEGDVIKHPSGEWGVIVYYEIHGGETQHDAWRVKYKDGLARLCLQIGDKGEAVKV